MGLSVPRMLCDYEYPKIVEFLREHWSSNHIFIYDKGLFDWQHLNSLAHTYNMIAIEDTSESLGGILGFIPQSHFDSELDSSQLFLAIWKKQDRIQSLSAGVSLLKELQKLYKPTFLGAIGLSRKVLPFYKALQFQVGRLDHFVMFNPMLSRFYIAVVPSLFSSFRHSLPNNGYALRIINCADIENSAQTVSFCSVPQKSPKYIQTRYLDHPTYKYLCLGGYDQSRLNILVIGREIYVGSSKIFRIVDIIGNQEEISKLGWGLQELMIQNQWEYIDVMSTGIQTDHYKDAGFCDRLELEGCVVPNYFEPFVQENISIDYAYKAIATDVRIFRGDSDQDRPNLRK